MDDFIKMLSEEQKAALLKALSGGDFEPEKIVSTTLAPASKPSNNISEDFTMKSDKSVKENTKRVAVKGKENTWSDDGTECANIKTPDTPRTPRQRKPPKMKSVTCHVCNKKEEVNASLVYGEFYRCDRCTG